MDCCAEKLVRITTRSALVGLTIWLAATPAGASPLYRSIDGMGNNETNLDWGAAGTSLLRGIYDGRATSSDYGDGISSLAGASRPSAREISNKVSAQPGPTPNSKGATDMLWQWGQFLDHDIDLTNTGSTPAPIPVPAGDPFFDPASTGTQVISLNRSVGTGTPRQQTNSITAFIDGSNVYGSDATRAATLRTNDGTGMMRTSTGGLLPFNTTGLPNAGGPSPTLFLAGDVRANEQVGLTALHTLFLREHNRLAVEIKAANPGFDGEKVYQEARKLVGAMMQSITFNEFLPMILGNGAPGAYTGYDDMVNPGIANEFSTGAYRFGHSMLSTTLMKIDDDGNRTSLPLAMAFFNPSHIQADGIEPYLRGLSSQMAQEIDPYVVDDVRNFLFGPPGAGGLDLVSLNLQRGRDHGLPSYNELRSIVLGVDKFTDWNDPDIDFLPHVLEALKAVYASIDDVDMWVGGLAESHVNDGMMGDLFSAILFDQFERLRVGDRFWYENGIFEPEWMDLVLGSSLSEIMMRNTGIPTMQLNAFLMPEPGPLTMFALGLVAMALSRRRGLSR